MIDDGAQTDWVTSFRSQNCLLPLLAVSVAVTNVNKDEITGRN